MVDMVENWLSLKQHLTKIDDQDFQKILNIVSRIIEKEEPLSINQSDWIYFIDTIYANLATDIISSYEFIKTIAELTLTISEFIILG